MINKELDNLKYRIYKRSWKADYITYKQFVEQQNVAYTFWELQKKRTKRKSEKRVKKDLKNNKKWLYNSSNM